MCRWVAFIAVDPILLADVLINPEHPITIQVYDHYIPDLGPLPFPDPGGLQGTNILPTLPPSRNNKYNFDGFGLTWYTNALSQFDPSVRGPRPALYKTIALPIYDSTFQSVCNNTASKCILTHIRAATRPPIASTNNHPFIFGRHSFMHNGNIANFPDIRVRMLELIKPEYAAMIYGNTDTEHFAALYFTHLGDIEEEHTSKQMQVALGNTIEDVKRLQGNNLINALNICSTDGEHLVALRYCNDPVAQPPSLYVSYTAAAHLNRKVPPKRVSLNRDDPKDCDRIASVADNIVQNCKPALKPKADELLNSHGPHVIVASEPVTFAEWEWSELQNYQFILVDLDIPNRKTKVGFEDIPA